MLDRMVNCFAGFSVECRGGQVTSLCPPPHPHPTIMTVRDHYLVNCKQTNVSGFSSKILNTIVIDVSVQNIWF